MLKSGIHGRSCVLFVCVVVGEHMEERVAVLRTMLPVSLFYKTDLYNFRLRDSLALTDLMIKSVIIFKDSIDLLGVCRDQMSKHHHELQIPTEGHQPNFIDPSLLLSHCLPEVRKRYQKHPNHHLFSHTVFS